MEGPSAFSDDVDLTYDIRALAPDLVENAELFIRYVPLRVGSSYVHPEVRLEFGARATGASSAPMWIDCAAAHIYCLRRLRRGRVAGHWYDLVALGRVGVVERALVNREIAEAVDERLPPTELRERPALAGERVGSNLIVASTS